MENCQPNCGCKFEVDSSCVRYTNSDLGTTLIVTGDTVETSIIKIDAAINNLIQTFEDNAPQQISGPLNKVVKFGPPSTSLLPSQTIDDGYSIGINSNPDPTSKVLIETSSNQTALKSVSYNNGKEAITSINQSNGSAINKATVSLSSGSTTSNIGTETSATGTSTINIGISSTAAGATNNYSVQLRDGTETNNGGKFLKDTGLGRANWNYIYLSDIQDYQPYSLPIATSERLGGVIIGSGINVSNNGTISVTPYSLPISTSSVLGGVKIGNGLAINGQGILSANIGEGTLNYVAKFTPNGYSIDDSLIQDDGSTVSIGVSPSSVKKFYVNSTTEDAIAGHTSANNRTGVYGYSSGAGTSISAVQGYATGNAAENIGVYGTGGSITNTVGIGGKFLASGGGTNYSLQLMDGTQGAGKFLKSVDGDGHANWAEINPQKTITTSYTLTSADNGYSIIVENGANAVTITIPSGLPTSMQVGFIQDGTGDVTFAGSTLNCSVVGATKIKGQYDQAYLEKKGSNEVYYLLGNVKV